MPEIIREDRRKKIDRRKENLIARKHARERGSVIEEE